MPRSLPHGLRRRFAQPALRLLKQVGGTSLTLFALSAIPVVGTIGLSTDAAIGFMVRHRLAEALDAAGLAAGATTDADIGAADFQAFFKANFPDGYMGATVDGPNLVTSADGWTLTLSVSADVPTTFMQILGVDDYAVSARTVITRRQSGMELALVMDNTGSMRWSGKIGAMRTAAQTLVGELFGDQSRIDRFWVSVVPYTSMVNIGTGNTLWVDNTVLSDYAPTTWGGCVEARGYPLDTTDDTYNHAPMIDGSGNSVPYTWRPAHHPNDVDNYWRHTDYDWDVASERQDWQEFGQEILIAHLTDALGYPHANTLPVVDGTPLHFDALVDEWVHDVYDIPDDDPRPYGESLANSVARIVLGYNTNDEDGYALPTGSTLVNRLQNYIYPHSTSPWPSYDEELIDLLLTAYFRRWYEYRNQYYDWVSPDVRDENYWRHDGTGPNLNCGPAITPLTDQRATIEAAIAAMEPWHRGGTTSNSGLSWGWRSISPQWRGLWSVSDSALPHDYSEPLVEKVVIILTDGVNQMADNDRSGPLGSDYTGFGRVGEGRILQNGTGTAITNIYDAKNELDRRMLETCTAMKSAGIRLYTITFMVSDDDTRNLFQACATDSDHYFNSPSASELQTTFTQIATELANLRIAE